MSTACELVNAADTFLKSVGFVESNGDFHLLSIELQKSKKIPSTPEEIGEFFHTYLTQNYLNVPPNCKPLNAAQYIQALNSIQERPTEYIQRVSYDDPNAPMLGRPTALTRYAQSFFGSCACTAPTSKVPKLKK